MVVVMMVMNRHQLATSQRRPLAKLTARLVASQIVEPREFSLTAEMLVLAFHVFVLGPVRGHMAAEIGAFAVEPLVADRAVHAVAARVRGQMVVADLLVGEGFAAAGVRAFPGEFFGEVGRGRVEGAAGVGGGGVCRDGCLRGGVYWCKVFFADVAGQGGFGAKGGGAVAPAAGYRAFGAEVGVFDVFLEVVGARERGRTWRAAGHEPLTDLAEFRDRAS